MVFPILYLSILFYVQNPIIVDSPKLIRSQRHHVITAKGADEHVHAIHQLVHLDKSFGNLPCCGQIPGLVNIQKTIEHCPFIVDLCQNSYGKWWFIVDLPRYKMIIFHRFTRGYILTPNTEMLTPLLTFCLRTHRACLCDISCLMRSFLWLARARVLLTPHPKHKQKGFEWFWTWLRWLQCTRAET